MGKLVLLLSLLAPCLSIVWCTEIINDTEPKGNNSQPNKDMYVINAMVYQVGIVTNKTGNATANMNTTGQQEALTFFHNDGSKVDLSQIPDPLLTNVKAQSVVGVAPVYNSQGNTSSQLPWSMLNNLTGDSNFAYKDPQASAKTVRDVNSAYEGGIEGSFNDIYSRLFKRETFEGNNSVAISKGAAVIPDTAGVQSIAIPPLLTLNNNLSDIPVPIPNTSIIHYTKINTLVTKTK